MSLAALDGAFPVTREVAYLNAGTCGPVPQRSSDAICAEITAGTSRGRTLAYYERLEVLEAEARGAWSRLLQAPPEEIALTVGATDGIARTLALVPWQPGDHVLISDEEHPGVTGPVGALARRHGVTVHVAPWDQLAEAVTPELRLVITSHVGWLSGRVMDLDAVGAGGVPVLIDGAQSAGAIDVDVSALRQHGVVAYAAPGQKWTCGPVGTGALWVDPAWAPDEGAGVWPSYENLADPSKGLDATPWPDARRLDAPSLSAELLAGGVASLAVLEAAGWGAVHAAGVSGAAQLARAIAASGAELLPRGASTLVTWRPSSAERFLARADAAQVVVRGFVGQPWVRASVGAWTSERDLQRLLDLVRADA